MLTNPHKMLICLHTQTKMHHEVISTFWFPLVINEKRNIALSFPEAVSRGLTEKHSEGAMSLWVFKRFVFIWGTVDAKFNPLNIVKSKRSSVKLGIVTVSARQVCFLSVLQSPRWHISFLISYHSDKHRSRARTHAHEQQDLCGEQMKVSCLHSFWHCAVGPRGCSRQSGTYAVQHSPDKHTLALTHGNVCCIFKYRKTQ